MSFDSLPIFAILFSYIFKTNITHTTPLSNTKYSRLKKNARNITFDSFWGSYDSDIAKCRLNDYLNGVIRIGKLHNASKIHCISIGVQISGFIHQTIQISNKENVIEQVKLTIEYISSFCYELTKHFEEVYFYDVLGNHSRLPPNKDNAVKDERLDLLIGWTVCQMLKA